jgi:alpha-beta hydrolase superfamily lysophospholipase
LRRLRAPTLVLHGKDDPLIPVAAGRHTAASIPGARLRIISGWGHDLPNALLPRLVADIADHCGKADRAAPHEGARRLAGRAADDLP